MAGTNERSNYWNPSRNYELSIKVGDYDLTNDLEQMYIISSLETPYKSFVMDFFLDPGDIILEKIYGQKPMKLVIKTFGTSEYIPHEALSVELMALGSKFDLSMKDTDPQLPDKTRTSVRIKAVPVAGYNAMSYLVRGVYLNSKLADIVRDLSNQVGADILISGNITTQNSEKIDQVIVPPSTLYNALQYLDRTFGFYHGLSSVSSDSFRNLLNTGKKRSSFAIEGNFSPFIEIKNISSAAEYPSLIITQLSSTARQDDLLNTFDGKTYYTYNIVEAEYTGNTAFSTYGAQMIHVVKPRDELYHVINIDTEDFINNYGISTKKNSSPYYLTGQINRTGFFKDHTGYDKTETHIQAGWSKMFTQMSIMKVYLEKWLLLSNLLSTGQGVKFKSNIIDNRDLTGDYVLKVAQAHFIRARRDWECGVTLHLIRSNRII